MASEVELEYKNFNEETNEDWKNYKANIFPLPSEEQLEKIKRRYFHDRINKNLPLHNSSVSATEEKKDSSAKQSNSSKRLEFLATFLKHSDRIAIVCYILSTVFIVLEEFYFKNLVVSPMSFFLVLGVVLRLKLFMIFRTSFREIVASLMTRDEFHSLGIYFFLVDRLPGLAKIYIMLMMHYQILQSYHSTKVVDIIRNRFIKIYSNKGMLELFIFLCLAATSFKSIRHALSTLLFSNFLTILYTHNPYTKEGIDRASQYFKRYVVDQKFMPSFGKRMYATVS